jgi:hypothetical protein
MKGGLNLLTISI